MSLRVEAVKRGLEILFDTEAVNLPKGSTAERRSRLWRRMRRKAYRRQHEALMLVRAQHLLDEAQALRRKAYG